jgi:hypothetical protein
MHLSNHIILAPWLYTFTFLRRHQSAANIDLVSCKCIH